MSEPLNQCDMALLNLHKITRMKYSCADFSINYMHVFVLLATAFMNLLRGFAFPQEQSDTPRTLPTPPCVAQASTQQHAVMETVTPCNTASTAGPTEASKEHTAADDTKSLQHIWSRHENQIIIRIRGRKEEQFSRGVQKPFHLVGKSEG